MKRLLGTIFALVAVAVVLASCTGPFDSPPPPPAQPIINNITPTGDNGTSILLAIAGIGAFLLFGIAIVLGIWGASEHRRRKDAENAVETLTGKPIGQLRMLVAAPISTERLQAMAFPTQSQSKQLER